MNNTKLQQMMCGRPDSEKVKFLRHTLLDFCKYIHRRGYRFDELNDAPREFFVHDKRGPQSGSNLIRSLLSIVDAEELVESRIRKN